MLNFATGNNVLGTYPSVTAKNVSGAGATDGTALIATWVNNIWGWVQDTLERAGLTPSGVVEAYTAETGTLPLGTVATQLRTALQMTFGGRPGDWWFGAYTPIAGQRILLAQGQTITIANYKDLVAATYCGDSVNNTAGVPFYKSTDSGGVTRSISGTYFTLPDARGVTFRGIDIGATRDPQGATRGGGTPNGSVQLDAFQGHGLGFVSTGGTYVGAVAEMILRASAGDDTPTAPIMNIATGAGAATIRARGNFGNPLTDGVNGTPRTSSETRMINFACYIGIRY